MAATATKAPTKASTKPRVPRAKSAAARLEEEAVEQARSEVQAAVHRRTETAIVDRYLTALVDSAPTNGWHTPERLQAKLDTVETMIAAAKGVERVKLIQERLDIQALMGNPQTAVDLADLEAQFIEVGAAWARRKSVTYTAFRNVGVPAAVLAKAGIPRTRRSNV